MSITLYGIANCDTVKKSRVWLDGQGLAYVFHDYKKQGVPTQLSQWVNRMGWKIVLNQRGTTWRALDASIQASIVDDQSAINLMHQHPSLIKRPIVVAGETLLIGFDASQWLPQLGAYR